MGFGGVPGDRSIFHRLAGFAHPHGNSAVWTPYRLVSSSQIQARLRGLGVSLFGCCTAGFTFGRCAKGYETIGMKDGLPEQKFVGYPRAVLPVADSPADRL